MDLLDDISAYQENYIKCSFPGQMNIGYEGIFCPWNLIKVVMEQYKFSGVSESATSCVENRTEDNRANCFIDLINVTYKGLLDFPKVNKPAELLPLVQPNEPRLESYRKCIVAYTNI